MKDFSRFNFRAAVVDELVVCHIYTKEHEANPRKAVRDIIDWHLGVEKHFERTKQIGWWNTKFKTFSATHGGDNCIPVYIKEEDERSKNCNGNTAFN